ncbi:uncharacterized protein EI97DRAFT_437692 [Westerdykella ornata]|uniref:mannan endo-1,6-alpha-mannosidase n=1 Tax=Westerdykella ornata TaxID=318751 RepID=A0A6A6J5T6_WESOR|nr:uncharacterized protein EI97DRAFT_437692 [Westerdykella ornata]KAF2271584.1 hypothetical protein EI97DRAFT_437692 [Westerdykella ornata]
MIEYTKFTGDTSYVKTLTRALVANYGPNNDILLPWKKDQEGNDDQAFWALALMSALEYDFPDPDEKPPASYLEVVENCFNNIVPRWDLTSCNGGFKWQIYPENAYGWNYKNSISNGAVFALAARLARYTGNQTYADWAVKIWDWSKAIGLVTDKYEVLDGTSDKENCTDHDNTQWTYNIGMYMHGAAVMYNYTNGDQAWKRHVAGFIDHSSFFFKPHDNAPDIMYEIACETGQTGRASCNVDQQSFKAYFARFLAKTAIMAPFTRDQVTKWLRASAIGAAKSCSGGADGATCGSRWYTGSWDGATGVGQQLSALEVTQALLTLRKHVVPRVQSGPEPAPPLRSSTGGAVPTATGTAVKKPKPSETPKPSGTSKPSKAPKPSETPQPSETSKATGSPATSGAPAAPEFQDSAETPSPPSPSGSGKCNCSPKSTTTVYVQPPSLTTAQPAPPGDIATTPLGSQAPPSSSPSTTPSVPENVFDGAAVTVRRPGVAMVAGLLGALLYVLL